MSFNDPTETLESTDLWSVGKANTAFGENKSLLVARPGKLSPFWFTVPEGFYALVNRHGAREYYKDSNGNQTCVWPAGLHFGPPWLRVAHLVTKQSVVFNTPVRNCRTRDNVTVNIDVALVLRVMGDEDPENVFKFVHMVTASGLQQQLIDAQAEAIRTLARSMNHTEVFGIRSVSHEELAAVRRLALQGRDPVVAPLNIRSDSEELPIVDEEKTEESERDLIGEHDDLDPIEAGFNTESGASVTQTMKERLNKQFVPQGVEILDVIIQQITVPDVIQNQLANKTYVISQNAEQRMQQKFDLLTLRQQENIKTLKQKHSDMRQELIKEGQLQAQRESLQLEQEQALGKAALLEIDTAKSIVTKKITAENSREVQQIRDKTNFEIEMISSESKREAAEVDADVDAEIAKLKAASEYECAKMSAEGDKALFKAEGISAPLNRTLNDHKTALKKLEAQKKLASNEHLIVTGTSGGDAANRMILMEATLNDAASRQTVASAAETSAVLSQLAVASGKAEVRLNMWSQTPAPTNGNANGSNGNGYNNNFSN